MVHTSDRMKGGLSKAPHRSLLKADGLTDEEIAFYDALAENESAVQVMGDDKLRVIAIGAVLAGEDRLALTAAALRAAGLAPLANGDAAVQVVPRGDGVGLVNLSAAPATVMLATGGHDLLSGEDVPATVALAPWQARLIARAAPGDQAVPSPAPARIN